MILIVVATDQLVWRPLIAWSDKFKFEQVESADRVTSPILELLRRSSTLAAAARPHSGTASRSPSTGAWRTHGECRVVTPLDDERPRKASPALWALAAGRHARGAVGGHAGHVHAAHRHLARTAPAARRRRRHLPARQRFAAHLRALDHSRRRRHRLQPAPGPHRAAASRRSWPRFRPPPSSPSCSSAWSASAAASASAPSR